VNEIATDFVHAYADHSKVHHAFEAKATVSLPEGIDRMSQSVLERGIPEPTRFPAIELTEGMPPSWP